MSKYQVRIRKKNPDGTVGEIVGRLGRYPSKKDAVKDAQVLADTRVFNPDTQITVEAISMGSPRARSSALAKSAAIARKFNPESWKVQGPVELHPSGAAIGRWSTGGWWGRRSSGDGRRFSSKSDAKAYALGQDTDDYGIAVTIPESWLKPKRRKKKRNPVRRLPGFQFTGPVADNDRVVGPRGNPNPTTWTHLGHQIIGMNGDWTILPYGTRLKTKAEVKTWLKRHVAKELK